MPRLPGFRRAPDGESPSPAPPATTARAVRRSLPPAGQLRRERRALLQLREQRLRDLGGLMLEMYRRDQFRQDLLVDRCAELQHIEEQLADLDTILPAAALPGPTPPPPPLQYSAPEFWGPKLCQHSRPPW